MESRVVAQLRGLQKVLVDKYKLDFNEILEMRRDLHKYPEIAFKETATRAKLIRYLVKYGIQESSIKTYAQTGFTCDIRGLAAPKGATQTIGFRADMDALPMKELNTFAYASVTDAAHMCGHDGHMATQLATANVLLRHRAHLPSNKTVRLIFQPAEEIGRGAELMIKEGALEGLDEVYALHSWALPLGKFGIRKQGPMTTGLSRFRITIQGKGSHGAYPEKGHDPLTALCQTHGALHTILSRGISRQELAICTVGQMAGGTAENIIPDNAFMGGTIRFEKLTVLQEVQRQLQRIVEHAPRAFGCEGALEYTEATMPTLNAPEQANHMREVISRLLGHESLTEDMMLASEDFARMAEKVPAVFMLVGHIVPGKELVMNHNPYFDYNEDIIAPCALAWIQLLEARFNCLFR